MPIYAYKCSACGHAQDVLQKMSDPLLTVCPECGKSTYVKQVTAAGFRLKGTGWYVTDFRDNGSGSKGGSSETHPHHNGSATTHSETHADSTGSASSHDSSSSGSSAAPAANATPATSPTPAASSAPASSSGGGSDSPPAK